MPTTTNMGLELPAEDGSSGTWDSILNSSLGLVDAHDHTSGNGLAVPSAGIDIDADLPFGGFAATGVKAVDFTPVATSTMAGYANALFSNSADGELYWRTSGGTNVQLTDGASLNSSLLGGFTGDYGAGAEEANYNVGSSIYNFLINATTRAFIDSSDIRLFEATSGITKAVKLKSPASLANSYTITMPAAPPASLTSLVTMATTGALAVSVTPSVTTLATTGAATLNSAVVTTSATIGTTLGVTGAVTMSAAATVGTTLGVTGATTLSSTLGVTGLITASNGVTLAANKHVTISGSGQYKHGDRTMVIPGNAFQPSSGSDSFGAVEVQFANGSGTDITVSAPIMLPAGKTITKVEWTVDKVSATSTRTYKLEKRVLSTRVSSDPDSLTSATIAAEKLTNGTINVPIVADAAYVLTAILTETADAIIGVELTYVES